MSNDQSNLAVESGEIKPASTKVMTLTFVIYVSVLALLLSVTLTMPIGPMYWDSFIYLDAINRLETGQIIFRDFQAPVGPLGYYLAWGVETLFPKGHYVLVVQWSLLIVTAPLMWWIAYSARHHGKVVIYALLVPFLILSALPFNPVAYNTFPGVDAYAFYNRQGAIMLYVLVAALFYLTSTWSRIVVISVLLLAMFFIKITAFLAAGLILMLALASGRISIKVAILTAILCISVVIGLEIATMIYHDHGMVSGYLESIMRLAQNNTGVLVPFILKTMAQRFDVIFTSGLVAVILLWRHMRGEGSLLHHPQGLYRWQITAFLARDWIWIGLVIIANVLYESQNLGSQAMISVWPLLLPILMTAYKERLPYFPLIACLIAFASIPTIAKISQSASRTIITAHRNVVIETPALARMEPTSIKQLFEDDMQKVLEIQSQSKELFKEFSNQKILPYYTLYDDHSFQANILVTMNDAVDAILKREAETGKTYEIIDIRDFTNPIPYAMGRQAPKGVAIGADPFRAVLKLNEDEIQQLAEVDLVLLPTCPNTVARDRLLEQHQEAYKGFVKFKLTDCFDALENPN